MTSLVREATVIRTLLIIEELLKQAFIKLECLNQLYDIQADTLSRAQRLAVTVEWSEQSSATETLISVTTQ
jgi:hypothetical protein